MRFRFSAAVIQFLWKILAVYPLRLNLKLGESLFFFLKGKAVFPGREKNFHGRQIAALDAKNLAGTGQGRLPRYLKIPAFEAVRRF